MTTETALACAALTFLGVFVVALLLLGGCQLHHPVPCPADAVYPDPCAYGITETVSDAGRDAR